MFLEVFMKGLRANTFSESLLQDRLKMMAEIHKRATTHIDAEETVKQKRAVERHTLAKPQTSSKYAKRRYDPPEISKG